ncbi:MAG: hypothetical protein ACI9QD_000967, partial [Thermoproteota archaeon]
MQHSNSPQIVVAVAPKSQPVGLALSFFFGPFGVFYSSILGGAVMTIISITLAIITVGLSTFLTIPAGMIWSFLATKKYNENLFSSVAPQQV